MATIYFTLSSKQIDDQQEILIRFSHGRINQRAKSNIFVSSRYWDGDNECIMVPNFRLKSEENKALMLELGEKNMRLNALKTLILDKFNAQDRESIAVDWLKILIDEFNFPEKYVTPEEKEKEYTLFSWLDEFIELAPNRKHKDTGKLLAHNNIQQYKATYKHLKAFARISKKKDFSFNEIDQKFFDRFVSYLQGSKPDYDDDGRQKKDKDGNALYLPPFAANSVGKHIRVLKLMLNEGMDKGIVSGSKHNNFKVFTEDVDNIYLNEGELLLLKELDLTNRPYLDRTRDWFLLLAWTGCRFSDLTKVNKSYIKGDFIEFRQQKTNNKVVIPVHPVVRLILEKYDYDLPEPISNQRFNEYIKEVCQLAGLISPEFLTRTVGGERITQTYQKWELASSHTGRRSFCTNMYRKGLPTLMIMSISGHKTEKAFLKYIKVSAEEHAQMMLDQWKKMYNE